MSMPPPTPWLLVLGGPDSGKSTFRGQVFQRFEHRPGALKLLKSVGDIAAIEQDVNRLTRGLQPMHTSSNTYVSTDFALVDDTGLKYDLSFADFDGEQLRQMSNTNVLPALWAGRAQRADAWLLFLRIDSIRSVKGFMTHPVLIGPRADVKADATLPTPSTGTVTEGHAIEMIQRFLFVRGASLRNRLHSPRLAVLLSCWDELANTEKSLLPMDLLVQRAPMLARYLEANWESDELRVWGLSSTEQPLPAEVPNKEFARKGPENFGYVVTGAKQEDRDLTLPITWLLRRC